MFPVFGVGVVFLDSLVEGAGHASDGGFVADVCGTETAGGKTSEVFRRFDEDDGFAHLCDFDGGDDASGRASVDDDVVLFFGEGL